MLAPQADNDRLQQSINEERKRYFVASRWSLPVGVAAAVGFYVTVVVLTSTPPRALWWWTSAMLIGVGLQIAAFMVPSSARRLDHRGIPTLSNAAYGAIGIGWGVVLWLDLDVSRSAEFRWITLATLFAVSAGVVSGIAGVGSLSLAVFIPMWVGACGALVVVGEFIPAAGCGVFAVICLLHIDQHGVLWTELVTLRVTSHEIAEAHMWDATHDSLTSLLNRSKFVQEVDDRAKESDSPISVMFIDLDRFKEVNDNLGHAAGDHVLIEAAGRIESLLRDTDLVGRFGGDEFCVLLGPGYDEVTSGDLGHRLIEAIEQPFEGPWGGERAHISASIGIARLTSADASTEKLLLDADFAMYEAKRQGRRRVVHFNRDLESELSDRLGLESDLRRLLRERALGVDGQPVFDLQTGSVRCVELLARWRLPGGGSVPPSVFTPLAEELGLIGEITNLMLQEAGRRLREWAVHPTLGAAKISVNVSASDLQRGQLVNTVADVVTEFGIEPGRLVLELTESAASSGSNEMLDQFEALRELGVDLAIDDFGAGYSSLDNVLSLPVHAVKLDTSLTARLGTDPRHSAVLRHIHGLATVIGTRVVVGGVETASQLQELESLGAELAQGSLLCRPMAIEFLADHLGQLRSSA